MQYSAVVSYTNPDTNEPEAIIIDTVDDTSIQASSIVTTHPTMQGTPMSDHMYKQPITLNMSGSFSLNGSKAMVLTKAGHSLAKVESMFERIKNDGIVCVITKVKVADGDSVPQFTIRENMVLQNISWTEKINSLGFSFGWTEVLRADVQEAQVDPDDAFAPDITYPDASNFSDTLLNWDDVDKEVIRCLMDFNLIEQEFLQYIKQDLQMVVVAGIAGAIAMAVAVCLIGVCSAIPIVGWIVAGVTALVLGIVAIFKRVKKARYKVQVFKAFSDPKKREGETNRFLELFTQIHERIKVIDGAVQVWHVSENKPQETVLTIDGSYYVFTFERSNIGQAHKLTITDPMKDDMVIKTTTVDLALDSFADCTDDNMLFSTSGSKVYLIKPENEDPDDLTKYYIVATQISPSQFTETMEKIVVEAIKY